ncbi:AIPR family protein [Nguyenibacter sp. L1]|uniref:AIPR family protein n=1 Tax=Nguyenibacter sp. L1 TaxID=3049350 RepID=UPI002B48A094|nr:AIPR family protein [Nguyenibacter sp. L1]WRH89394.1 AIPR family protein [Nguyenibacter sp. L1]
MDGFVKSHGLEAEEEAIQFEKFVNFSVMSAETPSSFELDDVTTGKGDDGIDGVAIIIDEEIIASPEDAMKSFSSARRNHDVKVVFTQAKRSESFDLGDFLKFKEAVLRFISQDTYASVDDVLTNARQIFDATLAEVPKIRNGKPSLVARFVTTGNYQKPAALETALADFAIQIKELGLFAETDVQFIDREELTKLWVSTYSEVLAKLELFSSAALPTIAGIDEAYLAVVKARDFVQNLLVTPDGTLRTQVFEENVRSYLGEENSVNQSISQTLSSGPSASRFPVLNNGITIVSPDVKLQGTTLHLKNFQIVNGCQTSNVLFEHRSALNDIMVNVKVVETSNEDVFSELVRATNSQSKIENTQFLSLRPIIKRIEQYFNTYEMEGKLYLERRERQYVGQDIPATRIFSVHEAAKCVTAMYCNRPELSSRYTKQMYEELTDVLFADDTKEIIFYAACLTLYRFNLLTSNSTIPQNMKRFKWHILALVRAIIGSKADEGLNSKAAERSAQRIIDVMAQHGPAATDVFSQIVKICQGLGEVTTDRLKRQAILNEMLAHV